MRSAIRRFGIWGARFCCRSRPNILAIILHNMKTFLHPCVVFLLALSQLSPLTGRAQTTVTGTLQSGGLTREYRLYVPAAYRAGTPVPLLFNLHGYGSSNVEQEAYGDFRPVADTANFLVVHPNGAV